MHMLRNSIDHGIEDPDARRRVAKPSRGQLSLSASHEGGSVLIVGHSNTVPELIRELGDIDVPPMADDEYDTLYVLSVPSFGHSSLLRMEY